MKLTKNPCQIIGVRLGELEVNVLAPERAVLKAKFVLLRDPSKHAHQNAGRYTKEGSWSDKTLEKFQEFVEAAEEDILKELFVMGDNPTEGWFGLPEEEEESLHFPEIPTLGGPSRGPRTE